MVPLNSPEVLEKLVSAAFPNTDTVKTHTAMIMTSITAYSTAVGPSSDFKNPRTDAIKRDLRLNLPPRNTEASSLIGVFCMLLSPVCELVLSASDLRNRRNGDTET